MATKTYHGWKAAGIITLFVGITLLAVAAFNTIITWIIMIGWGAAYNNGIAAIAPGFWQLYVPTLCLTVLLALFTVTPKS